MQLQVTNLLIYPIKSLAGISLQQAKVERRGLQYDRRWMLVDDSNGHITQREYPVMALLQPEISDGQMTITHRLKPELSIGFPLDEMLQETVRVTVWDDTCEAREVSKSTSAWFSEVLGISCKLVHMPDDSIRKTEAKYSSSSDDHVSFADGYPILIFDESSVAEITARSGEDIPANRFRGNIIFEGGHAHVEDELRAFTINGLGFHGAKPCSRCIMTTIDQETAEGGKEPLKTLASYRKTDNKIKFGQNVIPLAEGVISVGDNIEVKEMVAPIQF